MNRRWPVSLILLGLFFCSTAYAGPLIAIDEFGNGIGTLGPGFIAPDPGPGGLSAVLTYRLPFLGVPGDVTFGVEPGINFGGDVIRFNGSGTVIFYSDNVDGFDAPADTPAPPGALYANVVTVQEVGPEGFNAASYTALPGQPGFDPSGPSYIFVSDGVIPEPSTWLMFSTGLAGLLAYGWRRRKHSA